jgi:hypothetical protein
MPLQGRQHAGEDLEPQVIFVAQAVGATLDHPDLVVEPFDEAERDLVLGPTVGGNAVGLRPVPISAVVLYSIPNPPSFVLGE